MIDARDQIGVPVITTCPTYVRHEGRIYEIPADAFTYRPEPPKFEWHEHPAFGGPGFYRFNYGHRGHRGFDYMGPTDWSGT